MKKRIGVFLMTAGIVMIATAAVILIMNNYNNKKAQSNSELLVDSLMNIISEEELKDTEKDPFETEMKKVMIDGYEYVGYLFIPDLGLELPVMADWDAERLKISPCRYYGSTKTDNIVIAAHNYRSHFGYLGNLKQGSLVMFTDMEAENITYSVISTELLNPTDVDKVIDTGDDLILYTCTYGGASRIVVRCDRVK